MKALEGICLNHNPMNGTIPESTYELTQSQVIILQDTLSCDESIDCSIRDDVGFFGTISNSIGSLKRLKTFSK